jgi:hypothetical protein
MATATLTSIQAFRTPRVSRDLGRFSSPAEVYNVTNTARFIAHAESVSAPGHLFHEKLNKLLDTERFDEFVESRCAKFCAIGAGGCQ